MSPDSAPSPPPPLPSLADAAAVVCLADEVFRDAVTTAAIAAGVSSVSDVRRGTLAVELVASVRPRVVVLDLALTGVEGLRTVERIHAASPETAVIVSSPFASLPLAALEVGASYVVSEGDVTAVRGALLEVLGAARAGSRSTNAPSE